MCCLLGVRCVCVCPLSARAVARGLTALAFASTPSLRERPRFAPRRTLPTHTLPTSVRAGPRSRATCSPLACLGTKVASAGGVSPCLADLLGRGFLLYAVRPMPEVVVAPGTLAGRIPPRLATLESTRASRSPCTGYLSGQRVR